MLLMPIGGEKPCYKYCLTGEAVQLASCKLVNNYVFVGEQAPKMCLLVIKHEPANRIEYLMYSDLAGVNLINETSKTSFNNDQPP